MSLTAGLDTRPWSKNHFILFIFALVRSRFQFQSEILVFIVVVELRVSFFGENILVQLPENGQSC